MSSHDEIQVSQILYCNNGEPVVVIKKTAESITVKYRNRLHIRPISIIGDKLHVDFPYAKVLNLEKEKKAKKSTANLKNEQETSVLSQDDYPQYTSNVTIPPSCFQCMLQARDDCFGMPYGICEKYVQKPSITRKDMKNWPKYGDATAFRFGEHRED